MAKKSETISMKSFIILSSVEPTLVQYQRWKGLIAVVSMIQILKSSNPSMIHAILQQNEDIMFRKPTESKPSKGRIKYMLQFGNDSIDILIDQPGKQALVWIKPEHIIFKRFVVDNQNQLRLLPFEKRAKMENYYLNRIEVDLQSSNLYHQPQESLIFRAHWMIQVYERNTKEIVSQMCD